MTDLHLGAVIIGRNEGARLIRCLHSVLRDIPNAVYVDSGSSDGSVEAAQRLGAAVHVLDADTPFTAARARNEGVQVLTQKWPGLTHVQFIDGDCEMRPGWIDLAREFLQAPENADIAALAGRVRERHPDRSLYNRLADAEWETPIGLSDACGGIAIMNLAAFQSAGGFNPALIAGEEPELCLRLRRRGGRVWRLGGEMVWHDIDMHRFAQWWRRRKRAGFAYANGVAIAGASPDRHYVPQLRRALTWGVAVPLSVILAGALLPWGWLSALIWPAQIARLHRRGHTLTEATFLPLGAIAESIGAASYVMSSLRGRRAGLIEYK